MSGYTHCACRDCFEIIVSSNPARPELCDGCNGAGCGDPDAQGWPECQREVRGVLTMDKRTEGAIVARAAELYRAWEARPWYLKARDCAVSTWRTLRYRLRLY